jgi:serine protease Do
LVGVDSMLQPVAEEGTGTGVVVGANGVIVTNDHVVAGARSIQVQLSDGRKLAAAVLGTAVGSDLAVIKVNASGLPTAKFGDSNSLQVGDPVVAIGNALALPGGPTVTEGIVSALGRSIRESDGAQLNNIIQTDAAINPGNSGGPLVDASRRVVGINSAAATQGQNIGFAIAITPASQVIKRLEPGRSISAPASVAIGTQPAPTA